MLSLSLEVIPDQPTSSENTLQVNLIVVSLRIMFVLSQSTLKVLDLDKMCCLPNNQAKCYIKLAHDICERERERERDTKREREIL